MSSQNFKLVHFRDVKVMVTQTSSGMLEDNLCPPAHFAMHYVQGVRSPEEMKFPDFYLTSPDYY